MFNNFWNKTVNSVIDTNLQNLDFGQMANFSQEAILFNPYTLGHENVASFKKLNPYHRLLLDLTNCNDANIDFTNFSVVYFSIDYIAKQIASMDIDDYLRKAANIRNYDSDISYMLNYEPNSYQTGYNLKYNLITNLYYYGCAFAIYDSDNYNLEILDNGNLFEYWEDNVKYLCWFEDKYINVINGTRITVETIREFGGILYKEKDIMIFRFNEQFESPLNKILSDLKLHTSLNKGIYDEVGREGKLQGYVKNLEGGLGNQEESNLNKTLSDFVSSGKEGFVTLGSNNTEIGTFTRSGSSDKLSNIKDLRKLIQEHIGVPAGLVAGDSNQGKPEQISQFYKLTLMPLLENIEKELEISFFTKEGIKKGFGLKFNISNLLRLDEEKQNKILSMQMNAGFITINEGRLILGLPKSKDEIADKVMPKLYFNQQKEENQNKEVNNGKTEDSKGDTNTD